LRQLRDKVCDTVAFRYRKLKSFQVAQVVYDITARFCDKYVDRFSRTKYQMASLPKPRRRQVQAARASLEELKLDYEDFLRQRGLAQWERENPLRQALIDRRCQTADEVAAWIVETVKESGLSGHSGQRGQADHASIKSTSSTLSTRFYPEFSANAALVLLAVACALLDRQVERLAQDFENEGGFTERLYKVRAEKRI
jgi:four helix bundle suffix protein